MSSSSFRQGLQSCLEPARLVERRVLGPKLAPPKTNISRSSTAPDPLVTDSDCDHKSNNYVDMGGWSFLQYIKNNSNNNSQSSKEATESEKIYTPPKFKRTSSMLSGKSLEMCTESLGSETGGGVSESSDDIVALFSQENGTYETTRGKSSKLRETTRKNRSVNFPPPLTSISGATGVQVKSHRDGGRLVLKAVTLSSCHAYFHAERVDGRLRLHLMRDFSPNDDNEEQQEKEGQEQAADGEKAAEEDGVESEAEGEDGEFEAGDDNLLGEELEENNGNVGDEIGMGKLPTPSRCKESGNGSKHLHGLEPFLVAT